MSTRGFGRDLSLPSFSCVTSGKNVTSLSPRPHNSNKDNTTNITKVARLKCSQIFESLLRGTQLMVGMWKYWFPSYPVPGSAVV